MHLLAGVADIPGVKLVVVGDGPAKEALGKLIPRAVFTGLKTGSELHELVASFDVFVHPGGNETFSQAVQEALASGVPVVAAAAGGPLDLVRDGRTGLLYPAHDRAAMRGAVEELAADPETAAADGRGGPRVGRGPHLERRLRRTDHPLPGGAARNGHTRRSSVDGWPRVRNVTASS